MISIISKQYFANIIISNISRHHFEITTFCTKLSIYFTINSVPELRDDQKSPKNGSLNRDLFNFLYRYGIFWMPPGESSHPAVQNMYSKGGYRLFQAELWAAEVYPIFQKKKKLILGVAKKSHSHNFRIWASKRKSLVAIVYGNKWFKFEGSNSKIVGVGFFCNA